MKNKMYFCCFSAILIIAFTACTSAPDSDKAKTSEAVAVTQSGSGESIKIDTTASIVEWVATKVTGYHSGTVNVSAGELNVQDTNITGGNFTLNMNSIAVTGPKGSDEKGNAKLLGHLKSPDFFEVSANPEAKFVITSVKPFSGSVNKEDETRQESISKYKVANPTHMVSGNLTLKGVTKNIEFPAKITNTGNTLNAMAKFNIDRSQWNIVYPGKPDDLIRNDIHMGIAIKATK
jgi:polyisoprenoid-binding protein YceI